MKVRIETPAVGRGTKVVLVDDTHEVDISHIVCAVDVSARVDSITEVVLRIYPEQVVVVAEARVRFEGLDDFELVERKKQ